MTALYIILGIILFFVVLLSIRITVRGEYFESFNLKISWLFLKFTLYPIKKREKAKKEETAKPQEEPVKEEAPAEQPSEKKENIFKRFYNNQGFDGVIELINNAAYSLVRMMNSFKKHLVIRELYLWMTVSKNNDAADTALEYGRACQKVFPALSFICSTLPVRKYDARVEPDFLGKKNKAEFVFSVSVRPIFFINAVIVFAVRLVFKVVIKFLKGAKNKSKTNENINEGGAL